MNTIELKENNNNTHIIIVRFGNGSVFHKIIDIIKDIVYSCHLKFTTKGIILQGMDFYHISLAQICIHKEDIDVYQYMMPCPDFEFELGNLTKLLKCMTKYKEEPFYIRFDQRKMNELQFCYENKNNNKVNTILLKRLHSSSEMMDVIRQKNYDANLKINAITFQNFCKKIISISDIIEIKTSDSKDDTIDLHVSEVNGSITISEKIKNIKQDNNILLFNECYDLKYLLLFSKARILSDNVKIYFSNKYPLMLKYIFFNHSYVCFYLAPKIKKK